MSTDTSESAPAPKRGMNILFGLTLLGLLIFLWILLGLSTAAFWSPNNISNLLRQGAMTAILAVGQTFVIITAGIEKSAILPAASRASSTRRSAGTTRDTRPQRSASAASIILPVRHMSMALDLPTKRVNRWEPPMPGMTPSVISGCPNLALSPAMMKSQSMASSQPPPSA